MKIEIPPRGDTRRRALSRFALGLVALAIPAAAAAQGILTVTPGRSVTTFAGTGSVGYGGDGGDGGAAVTATLARPSGIAYDAAGDLFLADSNNHVVREISANGVITTVAGTGIAGFGGDGGVATSAYLDTPTAVAVDTSGNLFIADSHNGRIRKVSGGIITTAAGNGVAGFAGDGSAATSAQLALPSGVAVDASGNLYIADTNNQRIRKVAGGTITTVAGNGDELFAGDGGAATEASLDQPTSVAADASGNLYIADKNNQRVRLVSAATGTISTLAGSGAASFAGGFGGDGSSATNAALAHPVGVSVDPSGNVYIADTNNQRIRQVSASGVIATVIGAGDQGFGGDNGPAANVLLNSPRGLTTDASGNLVIADTRNQRLRAASQGSITFGSAAVGATSTPQPVTLTNTGTGPLTVASVSLSGPFGLSAGGTCSTAPITLAPGASCIENIAYRPTGVTAGNGSAVFSGTGINSQTVLLAGASATQGTTTLGLSESKVASLSGESVTFTATLSAPGIPGTALTGSVAFYAGATSLGSSPLVNGAATLSATLPDGTQTVTATYTGSPNFTGSRSVAVAEIVTDYALASTAPGTPSVEPGHSIGVPIMLNAGVTAGLTATVSLATIGLPQGLSVSFSPATAPLHNGQIPFTMNVTAAPVGQAALRRMSPFDSGGMTLALLLLPVIGRRRLRRGIRPLLVVFILVGSGVGLTSLTGCGDGTGFFGQPQKTYTVNVTATATDSTGGTLTRSTAVPVNVQ